MRVQAKRIIVAAGVAIVMVMGVGCETITTEPLTVAHGGEDMESQMEFWHALPEQAVTSNDDAMHALLLVFDETDPHGGYESRRDALVARGWLGGNFDEPGNVAVSRGTLARMLVSALEIEGGLTMQLLGPSPRYALRELQYSWIFPASAEYQTFTGDQFLSMVGRIEDYRMQVAAAAGEEVQLADSPGAPAPSRDVHMARR